MRPDGQEHRSGERRGPSGLAAGHEPIGHRVNGADSRFNGAEAPDQGSAGRAISGEGGIASVHCRRTRTGIETNDAPQSHCLTLGSGLIRLRWIATIATGPEDQAQADQQEAG